MNVAEPRFRERITKLNPPGKQVKAGFVLGKYLSYSNNVPTVTATQQVTGTNVSHRIERCWDQTNSDFSSGRRGNRVYRVGGNFTLINLEVFGNVLAGPVIGSNFGKPGVTLANRKEYQGYIGIPGLSSDPFALQYATAGGLKRELNPLITPISNGQESDAWNIRPKLERASLFTALAEAREIPAMLRQTSRGFSNAWGSIGTDFDNLYGSFRRIPEGGWFLRPKNLADHYLNTQFGWAPFISDINKLIDAAIFSKQYIRDLEAANGQWMKRARTLDESETVTHLNDSFFVGCQPAGENINQLCVPNVHEGTTYFGTSSLERVDKTRVWAEGSFKFYRPELDTKDLDKSLETLRAVKRHLLLFGLRINPTHLWQIMPWSWLIDWFSNLGDIIARVDEQYNDGMVAKYLYVMRSQKTTVRSTHSYNFWSGTQTFSFERTLFTKQRRSADSPYGFVLGGDLSTSQWSILAALGLSRNVKFVKTN